MYINQASVGSYRVHVVPGGKASPNKTVVDEAQQLGPKYWDILHDLTPFALVFVKASEVQGTEAQLPQHAKVMVQVTTHIFHLGRGGECKRPAEWAQGRSLAPELN